MTEYALDIERARAAAKAIVDGRDLVHDQARILVTLDHVVTLLLIILMRDPRKAAAMLNEGLVPGIEERLTLYAAKERGDV
jgi:hypothetical protein